jgi:hypothetical protein
MVEWSRDAWLLGLEVEGASGIYDIIPIPQNLASEMMEGFGRIQFYHADDWIGIELAISKIISKTTTPAEKVGTSF